MAVSERLRIPLVEGLSDSSDDLPHTITYALMYRVKIDSFNELPKDKRPPRDLWNKAHKLDEFFDDVFDVKSSKNKDKFIEYDPEEVE